MMAPFGGVSPKAIAPQYQFLAYASANTAANIVDPLAPNDVLQDPKCRLSTQLKLPTLQIWVVDKCDSEKGKMM